VVLVLPLPNIFSLIGFVVIGLGEAPFYPSMIHETPNRFGERVSQAAMGLQMAGAYVGSTFLPQFVGLMADGLSLAFLPWFLILLILGMFWFNELIPRKTQKLREGQ
jgi:fucose permease